MTKRPQFSSFLARHWRWLGLWAMLLAAGCQTRFPAERIPRGQWLVLRLDQPPAMSETSRAIQGWWLGARTIRQNPRAGEQVADVLARRLALLGYVNLYSPMDLRYYFADKRQALTEHYPNLTDAELDQLLAEIPDVEYGRELGADKILTGRVIQLYMAENRTLHFWWSRAEFELQVLDVASGDVEWTHQYRERDWFASQTTVVDKIVQRAMDDLRREVFLPMTQ